MKKLLSLVLTTVMVLSLAACGGNSALTKEEMISQAENVPSFTTIYNDTLSNKANVKSLYCDKIISTSGQVSVIEEDYVVLTGLPGEGTSMDIVMDVYLSTEEIRELGICDVITVVGYVSSLEEREYYVPPYTAVLTNYIMEDAYIVK